MATCDKVPPQPIPTDYVLILTEREAHYLASLLGQMGKRDYTEIIKKDAPRLAAAYSDELYDIYDVLTEANPSFDGDIE